MMKMRKIKEFTVCRACGAEIVLKGNTLCCEECGAKMLFPLDAEKETKEHFTDAKSCQILILKIRKLKKYVAKLFLKRH